MTEENKIHIKKLGNGDEALAQQAIRLLIPEDERHGELSGSAHLKRLLASTKNCLILALQGDNPVGFTIAFIMPMYIRDGHMAYLYDIVVHPDYRRKGIATQMINVLKDSLRDRNVSSMWVGAETGNLPAIGLYKSVGGRQEPQSPIYEFWYDDIRINSIQ